MDKKKIEKNKLTKTVPQRKGISVKGTVLFCSCRRQLPGKWLWTWVALCQKQRVKKQRLRFCAELRAAAYLWRLFFTKISAKMNVRIFSFALLLALFAAGCNNDTSSQSSTTEATATPEAGAPNLSAPQGQLPAGTVSESGTLQTPAATPGQTTPATAATGKVNPPHGQPGHVCGTPVGAPLGQAPASKGGATVSMPTPTPAPATTAPSATQPAKVAPGTNPPHGQPGHVCGTPVGAPLDGKAKN